MNDKEFENHYVHTPNWGYGKNREDWCQARVHDSGRSVGFHQCPNPIAKQIHGFGFCTVHARKIETDLGINKDDVVEKYVTGRGQFGVYIELAQVLKESEKSLTVTKVTEVYGNKIHYSNTIKKSDVKVFDTAREATEWAMGALLDKADASRRDADYYTNEARKLEISLKS